VISQQFIEECFKTKKRLVGNDELVTFLQDHFPTTVHRINSGTRAYDWTIPKRWIVIKAQLRNTQGDVILDYENNNLHLMTYSAPFSGVVKREDLEDHLFYKENNELAIPWVHSYYSSNWGFCLSKQQYDSLVDDEYVVDIQTEFKDDSLNIVEMTIKGRTDKEVLLTTYTCHPYMASDNVSGICLLASLYDKLKNADLKYTYRFLFFPETIGSLALLANKIVIPKNVEYALIATCVGVGETINYKKTHVGNHSIDNVIEDILTSYRNVKVRDYWPTGGSDERQFSSPKIRIPTGTVMRSPYGEYPEYHTSLDNLSLMSAKIIEEMTDLHYKIILEYEKYPKYVVSHDGGEPFLSKYNLYRSIGGTHNSYDHEKVRSWVLFLADGEHNIKDMARRSGYTEGEILDCINVLAEKKIIEVAE
jgi:aminopeptidase-like protein